MRLRAEIAAGCGRTRVHAVMYEVGRDLLVVVGGGERHIGAATLAEGGSDPAVGPQTVVSPPHKEAEVTEVVAREVAAATGRRTLAVAGIHLDDIARSEIDEVRANVRALIPRLISANEPPDDRS